MYDRWKLGCHLADVIHHVMWPLWYAHRPIYKSSCKPHDVVPMANLCQKSNPDENL
jgi:hypothetical protein